MTLAALDLEESAVDILAPDLALMLYEEAFDFGAWFALSVDNGIVTDGAKGWLLSGSARDCLVKGINDKGVVRRWGRLDAAARTTVVLNAMALVEPWLVPKEATALHLAETGRADVVSCGWGDIDRCGSHLVLKLADGETKGCAYRVALRCAESRPQAEGDLRKVALKARLGDSLTMEDARAIYDGIDCGRLGECLSVAQEVGIREAHFQVCGEVLEACAWALLESKYWRQARQMADAAAASGGIPIQRIRLLEFGLERSGGNAGSLGAGGAHESERGGVIGRCLEMDLKAVSSGVGAASAWEIVHGVIGERSGDVTCMEGLTWHEKWAIMAVLDRIARNLVCTDQASKSQDLLKQCVTIAESVGSRVWMRRFEANRATVLMEMGLHAEADELLSSLAEARHASGDVHGAVEALGKLAVLRYRRGDAEGAGTAWQQQLIILQAHGSSVQIGRAQALLGASRSQVGDFKGSVGLYEEALWRAKVGHDEDGERRALIGLCLVLLELGELARCRAILMTQGKPDGVDGGKYKDRLWYLLTRLHLELGDLDCVERGLRDELNEKRKLAGQETAALDELVLRFELLYGPKADWDVPLSKEHSPVDIAILAAAVGTTDVERTWSVLGESGKVADRLRGIEQLRALDGLGHLLMLMVTRGDAVPDSVLSAVLSAGEHTQSRSVKCRCSILRAILCCAEDDLVGVHESAKNVMRYIHDCVPGDLKDAFVRRRDMRMLAGALSRALKKSRTREQSAELPTSMQGLEQAVSALGAQRGRSMRRKEKGKRWERGLEKVLQVSKALNAERRPGNLMKLVVDSLLELTRAENAYVVVLDRLGRPAIESGRGLTGHRGTDVKGAVSETVLRNALQQGKAQIIRNALDDSSLTSQASIKSLQVKSIMACPLLHNGVAMGVIYVDNRSVAGTFDGDDLRLLEVLANQVAAAIHNSRLFADLERSYLSLAEVHERSVRSERLARLGEEVSGVAHDLNNIMTAILIRSQLLQSVVSGGEELRDLRMIEGAAVDGGAVVKRILGLSKVAADDSFQEIDLGEVIGGAVELTRGRGVESGIARGSWLVSLGEVPATTVRGNAAELREVFVNVIANAFDAMPDGGTVRIGVQCACEGVRVFVRDDGDGIRPDVIGRIFEPFFTTKGDQGNGLGLSVSKAIVERHGGRMWAESPPGEGACVWVELPVVRVSAQAAGVGGSECRELPAGMKVLVVDDSVGIRESVARVLRAAGCEVCEAASGEEGLEWSGRCPFDVVVSDIQMDGIGGTGLVRQLRASGSQAKVVIMSGSQASRHGSSEEEVPADFRISKPFRKEEMLEVLAELMSKRDHQGLEPCGAEDVANAGSE